MLEDMFDFYKSQVLGIKSLAAIPIILAEFFNITTVNKIQREIPIIKLSYDFRNDVKKTHSNIGGS
jgi:hypothetical protein